MHRSQLRPVIGIIGNSLSLNDRYPVHVGGTMNSDAVAQVAGCLPLIIPSDPRYVTVPELLDLCDGFLLTGGDPMCILRNMAKRKPRHMARSTAAAMR